MSHQISEQSIKALFDAADAPLSDEAFTSGVLTEAEQVRRRIVIRRVLIGVAIFLVSIPLEDFVLALSQILLVSLVELPDGLVSQLLAPVNTVGGLLSAFGLSIRFAHRKLFQR